MLDKCSDIMLARFSAKILPGAQQELRNGVLPWHKVEIFEVLLISEKVVMRTKKTKVGKRRSLVVGTVPTVRATRLCPLPSAGKSKRASRVSEGSLALSREAVVHDEDITTIHRVYEGVRAIGASKVWSS